MKKVRIIILFMTLFLGMFFFMPVKVFAIDLIYAEDWFNHISQFDFGLAYGEIDDCGDIMIVVEPGHEYEGFWIYYGRSGAWFEPDLAVLIESLADDDNIAWYIEHNFDDFDGYLYWNFEQGYWQIEYYEASELDYYKQRVDELEDEISSLEDEISSLEDEISSLEDEISSLENEIQQLENEIQQLENEKQQLEDALDLEYDRGYNDGYDVGYNEGLLVENNNDITKWFVPLIVIIIAVGIIEPIILIKRRG